MTEQKTAPKPGEPMADRPHLAKDYGVDSHNFSGLLPWSWLSERMANARNYWIGTTRPDGRPHVMPVWGVWLDEIFYFSTSRISRKGRNMAANPQIVVHLESGNEAVIFEGTVAEVHDAALISAMTDVYEAKYNFRPLYNAEPAGSGIYVLQPKVAYAWLEKDFTNSATRWRFEPD